MFLDRISKKISKYHIKSKEDGDLEFDESMPFSGNASEKVSLEGEKIDNHSKIALVFILAMIFILSVQTFKLQVLDSRKFFALAENNRNKAVTYNADRGIIYDKNKTILVKNEAIFDLVGIGKEIPKDESGKKDLIQKLSLITGANADEIGEKINKLDPGSYRADLVAENIGVSAAIKIESGGSGLPGIQIKKNAIRNYPDSEYFSQIIGYMGRVNASDLDKDASYEPFDFLGKSGIEYFYEKNLKGEKGTESVEVDALGKVISKSNKTDAKEGNDLVLSVDGDLQKKLQDTLRDGIKKIPGMSDKTGAAAVAIDPRNGKILALVSLPTFDNNIFTDPGGKQERGLILNDPAYPMIDRAISGVYPPGSTIKPVMGIAGLSEGIIKENTIINDQGVINVYYHGLVTHFYGYDRGGLGPMNIISAIGQSSDIYFYTVGGGYGNFTGLGVDKIAEYFKKFNLGSRLGIDLPSEAEGLVPTKEYKLAKFGEDWNLGNTYHLSIGQSYLLTTPLQVASWTEVVANGGTLYKPQVVEKILSAENGQTIRDFSPVVIVNNIADKEYMDIVKRGMRGAVLSGTAKSLQRLPVTSGAKTGTAQFGTQGQAHAWFTAFAPYDNPEIVLTVIIEGGGEGGYVSAPVAREVLNWYFSGKPKEEKK